MMALLTPSLPSPINLLTLPSPSDTQAPYLRVSELPILSKQHALCQTGSFLSSCHILGTLSAQSNKNTFSNVVNLHRITTELRALPLH